MARDSKGRFLKKRSGGKRRARRSTAVARRSSSSPARRRGGGRRRRGGGMGNLSLRTLGPPLLAAGTLGWLVKRQGGGEVGAKVIELAKKVPGQKTFGTAPAVGALALLVDRFVYRHRYLRMVGMAGLVIGAYDAGGTKDLKWLGGVGGGDADDGMTVRS